MTYAIRPATASDDATIRAMIRQERLNPLSLDWRRFLVAEEDSRIIGIIQMKTHGDGSRELASLAVAPDRQKQGIGRALVHTLLNGEQSPIYLTCASPLESYYEQFGFRALSRDELPPYYRRLVRFVSVLETAARLIGQEMRLSVMLRPPM